MINEKLYIIPPKKQAFHENSADFKKKSFSFLSTKKENFSSHLCSSNVNKFPLLYHYFHFCPKRKILNFLKEEEKE